MRTNRNPNLQMTNTHTPTSSTTTNNITTLHHKRIHNDCDQFTTHSSSCTRLRAERTLPYRHHSVTSLQLFKIQQRRAQHPSSHKQSGSFRFKRRLPSTQHTFKYRLPPSNDLSVQGSPRIRTGATEWPWVGISELLGCVTFVFALVLMPSAVGVLMVKFSLARTI
mmetsp:Transcript_2639/g.7329  ORF Transcript_2639/g.7329 Transcript_2639/m.7329 type:complete len:166 (-) Transcript_2639:857-1354(-)